MPLLSLTTAHAIPWFVGEALKFGCNGFALGWLDRPVAELWRHVAYVHTSAPLCACNWTILGRYSKTYKAESDALLLPNSPFRTPSLTSSNTPLQTKHEPTNLRAEAGRGTDHHYSDRQAKISNNEFLSGTESACGDDGDSSFCFQHRDVTVLPDVPKDNSHARALNSEQPREAGPTRDNCPQVGDLETTEAPRIQAGISCSWSQSTPKAPFLGTNAVL